MSFAELDEDDITTTSVTDDIWARRSHCPHPSTGRQVCSHLPHYTHITQNHKAPKLGAECDNMHTQTKEVIPACKRKEAMKSSNSKSRRVLKTKSRGDGSRGWSKVAKNRSKSPKTQNPQKKSKVQMPSMPNKPRSKHRQTDLIRNLLDGVPSTTKFQRDKCSQRFIPRAKATKSVSIISPNHP
ncbi:hypothetical protein P167DRAFT_542761 [Morchella conica CCBAS932]|uniref:Uncharacterized protein n=1 Tax=Morchella conica CCBAS932 TaxID=1392247 RepID=A0A3N4KYF6_9PEZI|nr:hypothetical protein P167DRAFT_542761 [Morchella conica CCBAS932]